MVSQSTETPVRHSIEKARLDLPSTKTQMFLACVLIVVSCFVAYASTLKIGFLLDDYLHLDYAARAVAGQLGPLVNNFVSNWGGSDIMKSYRPVISLSIFIDYLIYHTHSAGFHLTNLIAFCLCSVMVALITLELTGRMGARHGALTALWAGLLFSVYPLHCESVAWIIGRVDTIATAFYLASVYCFLRLELLGERQYLWRSLAFFMLALTSKEIAVSLPAAIALLSFLPPGKLKARPAASASPAHRRLGRAIKHAVLASLPYWIALALYAVFRQALLGTAVGGYGGGGLGDLVYGLKIFADKESLIKLLVPVSEEYLPVRTLAPYCLVPLIVIAATFLARQLGQFARESLKLGPILLPAGIVIWMALALVPAFQIWHIYPNLVGSRLFFLSSTGLCIALALLALPPGEPLNKRAFTFAALPGLAAMAALYLVWFNALTINLGAWQQASLLVDSLTAQIRKVALASPQKHIVILNLPQDYKGAGMLGRKLYLDIVNRPPFLGADLSPRLVILEPKITGSRDFIWPQELLQEIEKDGPDNIYIWSNTDGKMQQFHLLAKPEQAGTVSTVLAKALVAALDRMPSLQDGHWQTVNKDAQVVKETGPAETRWCEITSAANFTGDRSEAPASVEIKLPLALNPANPDNWLVTLDVEDERAVGIIPQCKVLWSDAGGGPALGQANAYFDGHRGQYLFDIGRYRSYLLSQKPLSLSLQLSASDSGVKLQPGSLSLKSQSDYAPQLSLDALNGTIKWDAARVIKNAGQKTFDEARFFVTKGGTTIDPNNEMDLYRPSALEKAAPAKTVPLRAQESGSLALSQLQPEVGLHQIVLVLASKDGKTLSLPSQPITLGQ